MAGAPQSAPEGQRCSSVRPQARREALLFVWGVYSALLILALVTGGVFCGKPATVTVHLRPENLVKMLPAPSAPLSTEESAALNVICGCGFSGTKPIRVTKVE